MADRDINGMQARNWKKADVSAVLSHSVKSKNDNVELFSAIKDVVADAVSTIRGGSWDDRYRSVVDMIMSRIRAVVGALGKNIDIDSFSESLSNSVSDKLSDVMLDGNMRLSDISIGKLAEIVQQSIRELIPSGVSSGESKPAKNIKQSENITQAAEEPYNVPSVQNAIVNAKPKQADEYVDKQLVVKGVENQLQRLNRVTYSKEYIDSIKIFAKNIDDQINSIVLFQELDALDTESIQDVNPAGKYIALAQEKLQHIYDLVQKCINIIQKRSIVYDDEIKARNRPIKKQKKQARGINVFSYGFHVMYLDRIQFAALNTETEIQNFGGSIFAKQSVTLTMLQKIYKLVKPKSLFEKIIDWIKEKVVKKAINNLISKLFDSCPFVDYFKTRLSPKFKEVKDRFINKLKALFGGISAIFRLGFKIARSIIGGIWRILKKVFIESVRAILRLIRGVLKVIYNIVRFLGRALWKAIKAIYGFAKRIIGSFFNKFKGKFKKFFGKLGNAFQKIKNFFKKPGDMFRRIKGAFKNAGTKLRNLAKNARNFMSNLKKKAVNALKNAGKKLKNAFKSAAKAVKNAVKKAVKTIVKKIAGFVKKTALKIMKKIGLGLAKKMAKKKAKKMGMKILINFIKKFAIKLIAKLSAKIAATAAVNVVPILGQVISICMMIWTIVDTIMMVYQIYKMFKEYPQLMDIVKEQVAEWASKAFSFFKDLAKWAANLFSNLMAGFKAMFHSVGDALFASNKRMNATRMQTLNDLKYFTISLMRKYYQGQETGKWWWFTYEPKGIYNAKVVYDFINNKDFARGGPGMEYCHRINAANDLLAKEDDSWWRDTDKMTEWILARFENFKHLFRLCSDYGIFFTKPGQYYSDSFINMVLRRVQAEKQRIKEQIEEAERQKELDRYRNLRLNFAGLKELLQKMGSIVKERQEKLEKLSAKVSSESVAVRQKLEEMYPKEMEEYDENNFKDNDDDLKEDDAA